MGKIYRSMKGKPVDIEALRSRNELSIAVGNVNVNARGDELGSGGKIVKKREEVVAPYYENNPNAIPKNVEIAPLVSTSPSPPKAVAPAKPATTIAGKK
jgi:hypothetical protein